MYELNERFIRQNLPALLKDKTTGKNIMLAPDEEITIEALAAMNLKPRALKSQDEQSQRTRKNAEVFTPAWVCKYMIDALELKEDSRVIEITCGEAPFIVSRYDAATGEEIALQNRVGVLDRKLRLVNEHAKTRDEWYTLALKAFQSVYGYELQGDSLFIARVNLFMTFIEYYKQRWNEPPEDKMAGEIADVIAWNFWQMDGLDNTVPYVRKSYSEKNLFGDETIIHEPIKCRIRDWRTNKTVIYGLKGALGMKEKYDFCIGNPPYHEETKDTSDIPMYHKFMDAYYEIANVVELITPARFLFNAGKTPKAWNEKMLNDPHFKVLDYSPRADKYFRGVDIKGGIAITIRDSRKNYGAIGTFSQFPELNSIKQKVTEHSDFKTLDDFIIPQNKWDLDTLYADYPQLRERIGSDGKEKRLTTSIFELTEVFHDVQEDNDVCIIGVINNKRTKKYVNRKYLAPHVGFEGWKVILPKSNGSGAIGEVLSTPLVGDPLVGDPLVGYTQTFIGIGILSTESEAQALFKYIKTKFARAMLGILKVTQDNPRSTWRYVPLQNFTNNSDIDWSASIPEIDKQLYRKYGLNDEEIAFIESHVKEMK